MKNFQVVANMVSGPFTSCKIGSIGSILNLLVRQEQVPLTVVENVTVGAGFIKYNDNVVSYYSLFEQDTGSAVVFKHIGEWECYNTPNTYIDEKGIKRLKFHPILRPSSGRGNVCVEFYGEIATPELHRFLSYVLASNRMNEKMYHVGKKAGHFFQSGSHGPDNGFFQIEFWGHPRYIKEWCDWCTANYRVGVDIDTYWGELIAANKMPEPEKQEEDKTQLTPVLVPDIVETNGKTVRQNNMEQTHKIPLGSLVEILYEDSDEESNIGGLRLWVVGHTRDCDGTPLYAVGLEKGAYEKAVALDKSFDSGGLSKIQWDLNAVKMHTTQGSFRNGFTEEDLKLIK